MKVYVVVEFFKGGKTPKIRGVYKDSAKAEEVKDNYRFAFISEHDLIQVQAEKMQTDVYVVYELLKCNVPRVIGVFKNKAQAEEIAADCKYGALVDKQNLI